MGPDADVNRQVEKSLLINFLSIKVCDATRALSLRGQPQREQRAEILTKGWPNQAIKTGRGPPDTTIRRRGIMCSVGDSNRKQVEIMRKEGTKEERSMRTGAA
jgi:hypothetical protein